MTTITFLIPSYKNLGLLHHNLPSVIAEARQGDEIIIAEDSEAITLLDLSSLVAQARKKQVTVRVINQRENLRFARNVNQAVKQITTDYFILLNSDVSLTKGVRQQLLATITSDPKIFAVTAREIDQQNGQTSGRNRLWYWRGRFWHRRDDDLDTAGATAWACGGSSIFNRAIWQKLAGFDSRYYPAYWEDIDLSFQAKKHHYQVLYQPKAVVEHVHETTNDTVFGQQKIKAMSWRSGSKFTWKNGNFWQRLQFLLFYPWWQVKQFPALKLWWLVIIIALATRLLFLGQIPAGLTVDETAIAYNGYGIWTQHRDEWLNKMPVSFRSYGDYKAPLAIYLNGLSTGLLGRNNFAVRLPFALASVGSIWFLMLMVDLLTREHTVNHRKLAAGAGLLMTLTPWSVHFGRLGFENNFALLFILAGSYWLLKYLHRQTDQHGRLLITRWWNWSLVLAATSYCLSLYSYHSAKVIVPLILIFILIYYHRQCLSRWRAILLTAVLALLLLLPLFKDSFLGAGLTRANSSYLFSDDLALTVKLKQVGQGFLSHLSPQFLIGGQLNQAQIVDQAIDNYRHGNGYDGVLTWSILFLIMVTILSWLRYPVIRHSYRELFAWSLLLIIVGILPATLTTAVPHSNQAFIALPGFILLATIGLLSWRRWWSDKNLKYYPSFVLLVFIIDGLCFLQYQTNYFQVYAQGNFNDQYATSRQTVSHLFALNLDEAFRETRTAEKIVDQIIISTGLEQEYIYALWARGTTPLAWQGGNLSEKYLFLSEITDGDFSRHNTMILVSPNNLKTTDISKEDYLIKEYYDGNGEWNLRLYYLP